MSAVSMTSSPEGAIYPPMKLAEADGFEVAHSHSTDHQRLTHAAAGCARVDSRGFGQSDEGLKQTSNL